MGLFDILALTALIAIPTGMYVLGVLLPLIIDELADQAPPKGDE